MIEGKSKEQIYRRVVMVGKIALIIAHDGSG